MASSFCHQAFFCKTFLVLVRQRIIHDNEYLLSFSAIKVFLINADDFFLKLYMPVSPVASLIGS